MRLTLQHFNAMLSPHPWTIGMGRELGNMKLRSGPNTVKDQNIITLKSIWRSPLRRFHLFAFRCVIYLELSRWSQWPLGNFWASWRQDPTIIFTHTKNHLIIYIKYQISWLKPPPSGVSGEGLTWQLCNRREQWGVLWGTGGSWS